MIENNIIDNINIAGFKPLITPQEIKEILPIPTLSLQTIESSRKIVSDIINKKDQRKLLIMGPCSIHEEKSALEYADLIRDLALLTQDTFFILMRTYFEKPRTTVGWKGFINDPKLDNSFDINQGLKSARKLLIEITKKNLAVATEALEPISPQYIAELISWTAIGARTTESQTHREMASGLSSAVGFKNNTDGNIEVAINAIKSAAMPHHFLGIDLNGSTSIVSTKGNKLGHLILRGGKNGPNYDKQSVITALEFLKKSNINTGITIDCSHDNSNKDYKKQPEVFLNCIQQIKEGNDNIIGLMLESHLHEGRQDLSSNLQYGVSITDGCIDFSTSKEIVLEAAKILKRK